MAREDKQDTLFVTSIEKGMRILAAFGEEHTEMGLLELTQVSGLDRSATQRLANTFHKLGYLEKDARTRRYRPSVRFLELANAYLWSNTLVRAAMPKLIELRQRIGETVNLALLDQESIVYAARLPNARTSYSATIIGRRAPALNTSSGRAILSVRDEAEYRCCVEEWPMRRYTPATLMDRPRILELIAEASRNGYAIAHNELLMNEVGVSAPIRREGTARAAIQCSVSGLTWDQGRIVRDIVPHLIDTVNSF
jgi:DNA-binding IclR family transcriptional regulator